MCPNRVSAAVRELDINEVRRHPWWTSDTPIPEKYRGPHQLTRNGWADIVSQLERREEVAVVRSLAAGHTRALDVGGGTGELTHAIATQVLQCTAVEPHPDRVAALATPLHGPGAPITVHPGHAEALPFPDHSFDIVFAAWVLPYVHDLTTAAHELARVCDSTKPGATIAILGGAGDNELIHLLNTACVPIANEAPDHQGFLLAEAASVLADRGFTSFSLHRTESFLLFPQPEPAARIDNAARIITNFWYEECPHVADMRDALTDPLVEHFARRPHAIGDQGIALVARNSTTPGRR
ncbi:class I SAM-dependent methyltransferase [Pseudonocardia sp. ICBG1293]|uniref:class I SAM-dependent methyltransferase n=1 Tax=Pseudonocardia sp. ICBG1293 TaxID=2844382 RepID=UPI001CCFDB83|nr:class I SAM-dependent methyltransferase [Pseudonocardia sp. ICBG1293]